MKFFDFVQKYNEEEYRFLKSGKNPFIFLEEWAISENISQAEALGRMIIEIHEMGIKI